MLASERKNGKFKLTKLAAIIIPIVLVLLVVFVVRGMFFSGNATKRPEPTTPPIIEETPTEVIETEPTTPPPPPEAGYYDVTGDLVKIRDAATTEGSKVLGTVSRGGKVQVKSFYNNEWAVIVYDGKEAYISRRYIKKDENLSPIFEEQ